MKKILLGLLLLGTTSFGCSSLEIHKAAEALIAKGVVKVSGNYFIINEDKVKPLLDTMPEIILVLAIYPDEHGLIVKSE